MDHKKLLLKLVFSTDIASFCLPVVLFEVREGFSDRMKKPVAIKMVNLKAAPEGIRQKLLPWEIEKLPFLRHENILKVYEIYQVKSYKRPEIYFEQTVDSDTLSIYAISLVQ